jgi:hypothetical protein
MRMPEDVRCFFAVQEAEIHEHSAYCSQQNRECVKFMNYVGVLIECTRGVRSSE